MYEPFAAAIARRVVTSEATSALPAASVRPTARPAPRRVRALRLRRRSAQVLISLAGRVDPTRTAA